MGLLHWFITIATTKTKMCSVRRIQQGAGESAGHRAQAADERTDAHQPHYAQQEVGRHERAGARQLRVRVQETFACACGRAPASRALAGVLQVRVHVQPPRTCA